MKLIYTILCAVLLTASVFAQAPEKMSYQAVIRNSSNQLITSQDIGMRISILQGSIYGASVYVETHSTTTNTNGLVTLEIGTGTVLNGDFTIIDWANDVYFIKTETDPTAAGGIAYTIIGTSQLMSVAYALHAKTAESIIGGIIETDPIYTAWDKSYNDLTEKPNIRDTVNAVIDTTSQFVRTEIDGDISNEIQTISRTGLTVTLTNGGTYQDSINTYVAGVGIEISNNIVSAETKHYVGELFGGGIIYYVDQTGQHGLIMSLYDLNNGNGVAWSNIDDTEIGLLSQNYYNGSGNTVAIIGQSGHTGSAAKVCDDYSNDGYDDWYLPSIIELRLIDNVLYRLNSILENDGDATTNSILIRSSSAYDVQLWSSTEYLNNYNLALTYNFYSVEVSYRFKSYAYKVRAIRTF